MCHNRPGWCGSLRHPDLASAPDEWPVTRQGASDRVQEEKQRRLLEEEHPWEKQRRLLEEEHP